MSGKRAKTVKNDSVLSEPQKPYGESPSRTVELDIDTERFKSKLEAAMNNFKVEALSEFLIAKRNMIHCQSAATESVTEQHRIELETRDAEVTL